MLFNTDTMTVSITAEKKASTLLLLRRAVSCKYVSVGDLRVLGGKLNFLAAVVPFGRSFCSFVWRLAGGAHVPACGFVLAPSAAGCTSSWSSYGRGLRGR